MADVWTPDISSRRELIDALGLAAEIEHLVLVQYLFAAFSLRQPADPEFDPVREPDTRRFKRDILVVTHEEMTHLAVVSQLRAILGAPPALYRPNLPQPPGSVDVGAPLVGPVAAAPSPFRHTLTRFEDATLARFARFELPEGEPDPTLVEEAVTVPEPVVFDYLGDLYRQIRAGFDELGADAFVADAAIARAELTWGVVRRPDRVIRPVPNLPAALEALDRVVLHGEGAPADREGSHYRTFTQQRIRLAELLDDGFDPALPCAPNPRVWSRHRDTVLEGTVIVDEATRAVADAANRAYHVLVLLLEWVFAYDHPRPGPGSGAAHARLREVSGQAMSTLIRPLGELLARLPIGGDDPRTAGFPFELYEPVRLPTQRERRAPAITDEMLAVSAQLSDIAAQGGPPRCASIAETASFLAANLAPLAGS